MTASIPAETPEQKARVERMKTMSADKIAPLVVYLASDASKDVTNQIFSVSILLTPIWLDIQVFFQLL